MSLLRVDIRVDGKRVYKRIEHTEQNAWKAISIGARASARLHAKNFAAKVTGTSPPYLMARDARIVKHTMRTARRRPIVKGKDHVTVMWVRSGPRFRSLHAMENGLSYEQYVNEHTRRAPLRVSKSTVPGQGSRKRSGAISVKAHTRQRQEWARHFVRRTQQELRGVAHLPVERALHVLMTKQRLPTPSEVTRGL